MSDCYTEISFVVGFEICKNKKSAPNWNAFDFFSQFKKITSQLSQRRNTDYWCLFLEVKLVSRASKKLYTLHREI